MLEPAEVFCDHFGLRPDRPDRDQLHELGHAFARLPYENLTKLVKKHRHPPGAARRRMPEEVVRDHVERGAGGTCFALTDLFAAVLDRLGYRSRPVLCDTPHRPANHCALLVELDEGTHLVDPGYLLHRPVRLPETVATTEPARGLRLVPVRGGYDLFTWGVFRYRVRPASVPRRRFEAVWDASFDWTMMRGVHVCAATDRGYAYVHDRRLCLRGGEDRRNENIRGAEPATLAARFGFDRALVAEAYRLVEEARARRSNQGVG